MYVVKTVGGVPIYSDGTAYLYKTGATVNGDGSPHCYHPDDSQGLDYLANAGHPGNWWGVYAPDGQPLRQGIDCPAPGYYISTTALADPGFPEDRPERYIDSERYPFMVVPGSIGLNWFLGDVGMCWNTETGDTMYAATADIGPKDHLGEISMLLAKCLGLDHNPKTGGTERGIVYVVFPESDPDYRPWSDKCQIAVETFTEWGGMEKLKTLVFEL